MMDMVDSPAFLHDAMAFLEEGHHRLIRQYVELNLLSLNNDSTYQNSGGVSYSTELPQPDCDPGRVRPIDMWASARLCVKCKAKEEAKGKIAAPPADSTFED